MALVALLQNASSETLVLQGVRLEGPEGIGTVVRTEGVEVAPLPTMQDSLSAVPGGLYETYPPVFREGARDSACQRQALHPILGYRLMPQAEVLLAVRVRALRVGEFDVRRHVVTYRSSGELVQQSIEIGIKGEVANVQPPSMDEAERSCIREAGANPY